MAKAMSVAGMVIGGLLLLLFSLDLALKTPFGRIAGGIFEMLFDHRFHLSFVVIIH